MMKSNSGRVSDLQVVSSSFNKLEEIVVFFKSIPDSPAQIVQIFSTEPESVNRKIISAFNQHLTLSTLMGITAEKVILENEIRKKAVNITVIRLEKSSFKLLKTKSKSSENAAKIKAEVEADTKAVIVFSDARHHIGESFIKKLGQLNTDIVLAGGQASQGPNNEQGYIFDKEEIIKKGSLTLILNGSQLQAKWNYSMGWDSISRELEITRSKDQIVYELDGRNIFKVYSEFLGEDIRDKLPSAAMTKFPLVFNDGFKKARSAVEIVGDGIKFSGEFKNGDKVKIAYGSLNKILSNSMCLQQELHFHPELALVFSCAGRSQYLNSLDSGVEEEIKVIPSPKAGFLSSGEYGIINKRFHYLNITTTVLYLSEKKK